MLDRITATGHVSGMGTLSWILLLLALNGGVLALLLVASPGRRVASRLLAALVGLISLRLVIYVLGFAGKYDAHPGLIFAPLDASLAFGPLLWLYLCALTRERLPLNWHWHLAPAVVQLAYLCVTFALPTDMKLGWYRGAHLEVVEPLGLAALLLSSSIYLIAAWRRQRDYQRWLDEQFADRDQWRLGWMTALIAAFAVTLGGAVVAAVANWTIAPLDYFGRTPVVIASSLLAYVLGLLGWRHATLALPPQLPTEQVPPDVPKPTKTAMAFPTWAQRIELEGWWREEGVTLAGVARHLGVSERSLSRGLKESGAGNFNTFINGLRVAAVMRAIRTDALQDLLSIAFDCGFNSKASFNRAFLKHAGTTPSRWRIETSQKSPISGLGTI